MAINSERGYHTFAEWAVWHTQNKKRIAIVATGGTIASVQDPIRGARPAVSGEEIIDLAPKVKQLEDQIERIDIIPILQKDSSDITSTEWPIICREVNKLVPYYHGILILHGTDTLANTANALTFALRGHAALKRQTNLLTTPIYLVSSQKPALEIQTDAIVNLEDSIVGAIRASDRGISEIMTVTGHEEILRANRAEKKTEVGFNIFQTAAYPPVGTINSLTTNYTRYAERISEYAKRKSGLEDLLRHSTDINIAPDFADGVTSIILGGSTNAGPLIRLLDDDEVPGLILHSFGAGNIPFSEELHSMVRVIEHGTKIGKPVIIATQISGGDVRPEIYEAGRVAVDAGAIPAGNMTPATVHVKLAWMLAQPEYKSVDFIREHFRQSIGGEVGYPDEETID